MTVTLDGVTQKVGAEQHLHPLSLELQPGTFNVLLGRTLAGKTTLMRLMAGLDAPASGRVYENGKDVTGASVRSRDIAMVYQQFINYPAMTVFENIASPLRRQGKPAAEIDRKVRSTAAMLRIDPYLDRLPAELSGGQQQRCAIARALVKGAGLLLLDEPLVNLDYKLREELRAELRDIFADGKTTVVYATTEPQEALTLGGSVAVLHEGRLLQTGPTAAVFHAPATEECADVFSDPPMNVVEAILTNDRVALADGTNLPLSSHDRNLPAGPCRVGIRANHLTVLRRSDRLVPIRGRVELSEISGSETYIHLRHGNTTLIAREDGVHTHPIGSEIQVYADPDRVFVFATDGRLVAAPHGRRGLLRNIA
ncbi:ABC transporter ATP-binding protein [Azospirillum agricola]|uniref:ABC transporter ATP-binding protein n=1 Tax=Azospirillum agricola TaxID=1720247 RepID=UPI000A0EFD3E|nr:ABC transporter ATP-binding protein [Azospirillum agricola]SMH36637.1 carbohydrate ABC transporter ATP-binding protein, CUT1 family [Azospirillum lipoferum]